MIQFPVLHRVTITGYQLFPGINGAGIDRTLPPGVTLIVGINGLGKTTLLNAIFRTLSGPYEWEKRRLDQPAGSTPTRLTELKNVPHFRRRVRDEAAHAHIELTVGFGNETIEIRRSLRNLELTRLVVRRQGVEPLEEQYQRAVTSLAGLQSFEDFFLVLRYLTFFFEERQPIVWDASAQTDILRVLFFDPGKVTRVRVLFDKIQQVDSRRRNIRVVFNKLTNQLRKGRAAQAAQPELAVRGTALQTQANALAERRGDMIDRLGDVERERQDARLRVETTKLEVESLRSEYAAYERAHLSFLFPRASAVAQYVFLRRDTGCLVCGNQGEGASEHIDRCAADHVCPACYRTLIPEPGIVSSGEVNVARMQELDDRLAAAMDALANRQDALLLAQHQHDRDIRELRDLTGSMETVRRELDEINAQLPPTEDDLGELAGEVRALEREMDTFRAEQREYEQEFAELLAEGEHVVREVSGRIAERFAHFARAFLSERCDLQYQTDMRKIGEEGARFPFPRFTVRMTSATMRDDMSPRHQPTEVSESQREFIDLAFRMALMDVAASGRPAMLVMETPEASLDVLFVERAGHLLGEFALAGSGPGNRLLATSNLTGGEMIQSLLGVKPDEQGSFPRHHVPPDDRNAHVINLLEVAAPNAAIEDHGTEYRLNYQLAVHPEKF